MASFTKVPCLVLFLFVFNVNVHKCMLIIFKYLHTAPSKPQLHKRANDSSILNDPCAKNKKTIAQNFLFAGLDDDSLAQKNHAILPIAKGINCI